MPRYDPQVVYVTQPVQPVVVQEGVSTGAVVAASAISFGAGLALGAWLNTDCDWHHYGVAWCQPGRLARLCVRRGCLGSQPRRCLGSQQGDDRGS